MRPNILCELSGLACSESDGFIIKSVSCIGLLDKLSPFDLDEFILCFPDHNEFAFGITTFNSGLK